VSWTFVVFKCINTACLHMSVKTMVLLLTWNKAGWSSSCLPCNKISSNRSAANVLNAPSCLDPTLAMSRAGLINRMWICTTYLASKKQIHVILKYKNVPAQNKQTHFWLIKCQQLPCARIVSTMVVHKLIISVHAKMETLRTRCTLAMFF